MADELITFRDAVKAISPTWLRIGTAEKLLYSIGVHLDGWGDCVTAAIKHRFPGYYTHESLPILARDRKMIRGPSESKETFAARLCTWLDAHRQRGGAPELLRQTQAYYQPNPFAEAVVNYLGLRYSVDAAGSMSTDTIVWSPDDDSARWPRWWLFYDWPGASNDDGKWQDWGTWNDGGVWDSDLTEAEARDIATVPRAWNAAHCASAWVVLLKSDRALWDYPPGLWDDGTYWEDRGPAVVAVGIPA